MIFLLMSAMTALFVDQSSKSLVEHRLSGRAVRLGNFLRIRSVASVRSHYRTPRMRTAMIIVWIAAFIAATLLVAMGRTITTTSASIAVGVALGGAAGNLMDVLRARAVRDFIDLGWWPAFNVADIAIVAGLAIAFLPR